MLSNMSNRAYATFIVMVFVLTFLVTCFLMAGAASASASTASPKPGETPLWAWTKSWEACASDEQRPGARCVWNARRMGNGTGTSYIQTKRGHLIYITHLDAATLLRPVYAD